MAQPYIKATTGISELYVPVEKIDITVADNGTVYIEPSYDSYILRNGDTPAYCTHCEPGGGFWFDEIEYVEELPFSPNDLPTFDELEDD